MSTPVPARQPSPHRASADATDLYGEIFKRQATALEVVPAGRLTEVGARPPLRTYLGQLWNRRHFLVAEARAKASSGTKETLLGQAWMVINPILNGLAYYLIFGVILGTDRGIENFIGYLVIGIFLFQFTSQTVANGAKSVQSGRNLIRAFTFPRASLPISVVLRNMLNLVPTIAAMLLLIAVMPEEEQWTLAALLFPVVLVLQILFATGLALFFARVTTILPDISQLIAVAMRIWLYGSAEIFSVERFAEFPAIYGVMQANPMFMVLDAARDCLLYATVPGAETWIGLSSWALGALVVGFLFFWQEEESYGRA